MCMHVHMAIHIIIATYSMLIKLILELYRVVLPAALGTNSQTAYACMMLNYEYPLFI